MRRIFLIVSFSLFCSALYSQNGIHDFYSIMTSPNVEKNSEVITFKKTDNGVVKTIDFKRDLRVRNSCWKDYWKNVTTQIDSLNAINYLRDTILVFQEFNGVRPYEPFTLVISGSNKITPGYGSVEHLNDADGWPFYYDYFHPILINPIWEWDMDELSNVIFQFGYKPGEIEGPTWIVISRIIIDNNKKIETSEIHLDGMCFTNLRTTNIILH